MLNIWRCIFICSKYLSR